MSKVSLDELCLVFSYDVNEAFILEIRDGNQRVRLFFAAAIS